MQALTQLSILETLRASVIKVLANIAPEQFPLKISPLPVPHGIAEDLKLLVKNRLGQPFAAVLCSPTHDPDAVARNVRNVHLAQQVLGADLNGIFVEPLVMGVVSNLSYGIFPYCQSWSKPSILYRLQRHRVLPRLLDVIYRFTELSCTEAKPDEIYLAFIKPLKALAERRTLPKLIRNRATYALKQLDDGQWLPRHALMHGDCWGGNVLFRAKKGVGSRFSALDDRLILIDWTDSEVKGYPIYDLMSCAVSLRLGKSKLQRHLAAHCEILGCALEDVHSYFIAAIAHFEIDVAWCPSENLIPHAIACLDLLDQMVPLDR